MPTDNKEVAKEAGQIDEQRPPFCTCEYPCAEDIYTLREDWLIESDSQCVGDKKCEART